MLYSELNHSLQTYSLIKKDCIYSFILDEVKKINVTDLLYDDCRFFLSLNQDGEIFLDEKKIDLIYNISNSTFFSISELSISLINSFYQSFYDYKSNLDLIRDIDDFIEINDEKISFNYSNLEESHLEVFVERKPKTNFERRRVSMFFDSLDECYFLDFKKLKNLIITVTESILPNYLINRKISNKDKCSLTKEINSKLFIHCCIDFERLRDETKHMYLCLPKIQFYISDDENSLGNKVVNFALGVPYVFRIGALGIDKRKILSLFIYRLKIYLRLQCITEKTFFKLYKDIGNGSSSRLPY